MQVVTTVRFSRWESEIIVAAARSAWIGYPNGKKDSDDAKAHSLLRALVDRNYVHPDMLLRAIGVLQKIQRSVEVETRREHWLEPGDGPGPVGVDGVPLVADPEALVDMLIEIRRTQLVEVKRALALLYRAINITGPPREIDPESEEDGDESVYHEIMEQHPMVPVG